MPMLHEYSTIRRSRNWTIMNVQSVLLNKSNLTSYVQIRIFN